MAPFLSLQCQKTMQIWLLLVTALSLLAICEAGVESTVQTSAGGRRLLSGTGPNPSCPDADFPNQCYTGDGSAYACCTGSCGPTNDNKASCVDGKLGPTASSPANPSTNPPANPSTNPPANPSTNPPASPNPNPPANSSAVPPRPVATPISGGASNCPAGAFQNPCFTPNGDAYICCSASGCGTPDQATNTATCADNKYLPLVPAIYVFGDSLVDSGNGQYINGNAPYPPMPPYGVNPDGPSVEGRFSDGPLVSDYTAQYLGLPFAPPILQPGANFYRGANFASEGSGALNTTVQSTAGKVLPLLKQIDLFLQFEASSAAYYASGNAPSNALPTYPPPATFPGSLYLIITGANDIRAASANPSQFPATATALVTNIATSIQTLYVAGARVFVVGNLAEIGCLPLVRNLSATGDCNDQLNAAIAPVNAALAGALAQLRAALPGTTILELDLFSALTKPFVAGVTNFKQACCGSGGPANTAILCASPGYTVCSDPLAHFFWDYVHPTTQVHAAVARELATGNTLVSPANLYQALGSK